MPNNIIHPTRVNIVLFCEIINGRVMMSVSHSPNET